MVQYPATVLASGLTIPVRDSADLIRMYDIFFTTEVRCVIAQSGATHAGTSPKYAVKTARDGVTIGSGLIWAQLFGTRLKITRIIVPPGAARPGRRDPRRVTFFDNRHGPPTAKFSGVLSRDEVDSFVFAAKAGQTLNASIDGFQGRNAVLRVIDMKTGRAVADPAREGTRIWTGQLSFDGEYRVEVVRLAPFCDPPLLYALIVTLR
jgi:hypothetical protein